MVINHLLAGMILQATTHPFLFGGFPAWIPSMVSVISSTSFGPTRAMPKVKPWQNGLGVSKGWGTLRIPFGKIGEP